MVLRDFTQRVVSDGNVPNELMRRAQASIATTQRVNAEAAAVVPVVGLLLAGEWQRPEAERVAAKLRERGFRIQIVRPLRGNAIASQETEVRHYRAANDPADAAQIAALLETEFGLQHVSIEPASKIDSPANKYEIWFGRTAFAPQPAK